MVQYYLYWTEHGADDISIWYFTIKHAIWLHNSLPQYCYGITSLECLTSNKAEHQYLRRLHVRGCPVLVLDPKLKTIKIIQSGIGALT